MMLPSGAVNSQSQPFPSAKYHFGKFGDVNFIFLRSNQYWQSSSTFKPALLIEIRTRSHYTVVCSINRFMLNSQKPKTKFILLSINFTKQQTSWNRKFKKQQSYTSIFSVYSHCIIRELPNTPPISIDYLLFALF